MSWTELIWLVMGKTEEKLNFKKGSCFLELVNYSVSYAP